VRLSPLRTGEGDVEFVGGTGGEIGFEHLGLVAGGEENPRDAAAPEAVELPLQKGAAIDGNEGLGHIWKLRGDARAPASE